MMKNWLPAESGIMVRAIESTPACLLYTSTKDPKDKNADRLEMQAENLRKMFLAMAKDIRRCV